MFSSNCCSVSSPKILPPLPIKSHFYMEINYISFNHLPDNGCRLKMFVEVSAKVKSIVEGTRKHRPSQMKEDGKVTLMACIAIVVFEYGLSELILS